MLPESLNLVNSSRELFSNLQTRKIDSSKIPPKFAERQFFDENFQGMFINKPTYKNCTFNDSVFERPAGESSTFYCCNFIHCLFKDADFRYSDIEDTSFVSGSDLTNIINCNFSYSTLSNTKFIGVNIEGTPFREMELNNCLFQDCIFNSFGFERTNIKNTVFKNIDMSKIVFRFCNFENVNFENITIHILDLLKNYGLIKELINNGKDVKVFYGKDNIIELKSALSILPSLLDYYMDEKEYYYVINILALENDFEHLQEILPIAFNHVIKNYDFSALQDLCNLIVKLSIFDLEMRKRLYNIITNNTKFNELSNHKIRSYTYYLDNIKRILLENPNEYPTASIKFCTDINPGKIEDLAPILSCIEYNIKRMQIDASPKIEISHHSPYEIVLYISAALPTLLTVCQIFYYAFGGTKSLKDILSSRHEKTTRKVSKSPKVEKNTNKKKEISLKLGNFEFQYSEQCESHVENVEYLIS